MRYVYILLIKFDIVDNQISTAYSFPAVFSSKKKAAEYLQSFRADMRKGFKIKKCKINPDFNLDPIPF